MISLLWCVPLWVFVCCLLCVPVQAQDAGSPLSSAASDSLYKHDPYDISQVGVVDSTDVYVTKVNHILRLPRYVWTTLVHPLGEFVIYAEYVKLWVRYYDLFTNKAGTFGIFPQGQLGGETGSGGGARIFTPICLAAEIYLRRTISIRVNGDNLAKACTLIPICGGKGLSGKFGADICKRNIKAQI